MTGRSTWKFLLVSAFLQTANAQSHNATIPINLYFNWTVDLTETGLRPIGAISHASVQVHYPQYPPSPFDTYDDLQFYQDKDTTLAVNWHGSAVFVRGAYPPESEYTISQYKGSEPRHSVTAIPSTSSNNVNAEFIYFANNTYYGDNLPNNGADLRVTRGGNQLAQIDSFTTTLGMISDAYVHVCGNSRQDSSI